MFTPAQIEAAQSAYDQAMMDGSLDPMRVALAAAEAAAWQDMSTAPKDGTLILACADKLRTSMVRFVRNHKGPESYSGPISGYTEWQNRKGSDGWLSVEGGGWLVAPTHWRPLPHCGPLARGVASLSS